MAVRISRVSPPDSPVKRSQMKACENGQKIGVHTAVTHTVLQLLFKSFSAGNNLRSAGNRTKE